MKRITFKQFLMTYNFRYYRDELVKNKVIKSIIDSIKWKYQ